MSEIQINNNELKPYINNKKQETKKVFNERPCQKVPFSFFVSFLFKNLFFSVSNIIVIFLIPLIIFILSTYLYPFFNSFSTTILFPSILLSVFILPRIIFRFNNQSLIAKRSINYFLIPFIYFIFNIIYTCLMFGIFILVSAKYWNHGVLTLSAGIGLEIFSPSLSEYLSRFNWGSFFFCLFQISFIGTIIGTFIGLVCYRNISLWIFILAFCAFVFGFSLLSLPGIFPSLPESIQYLSIINPFTSSFNLSLMAFNGCNIFNIDELFKALVVSRDPQIPTNYFLNNTWNILNIIMPFIYSTIFLLFFCLYFFWNFYNRRNVNENNSLFIEIKDFKRSSSFKTIFMGVPETFKVDGMDDAYKNYIFNIDNKKYNKFAADILTNRVKTFKKDTIVFKDLKTLNEIEVIHFNNAPLSGLKVKDLLNYYKQINFNKFQSTIQGFDFKKMLKSDINCLDYDSLFYLIIFTLLFNDKKIFIIDNKSLSKISKKAVDIVERKELYYWLINDIRESY